MAKTPFIIAAAALVCGLAGNLSAQTALRDQPEVRDGIIQVGMAYEISQQCDEIRARTFRGISYLQSLKRRAAELGYSEAEIDAYVSDRDEKRRLEAIAREQLSLLGVVADDPATYCAVGRAQMAANTRVGWLLR
ncbi:hypothetical protein SAMN04488005_1757 [Yoonia tamlensis]|uniref:NADH dehydrogenase subunit E n=1 Tax=Yoonia tamlensis TaxID=390270 RepID=A0A1I6GJH8_9RHOB|nr:DUF5333 domain-containing protein [Yoonia tamlensis]SFR42291.1 hypothetical protein SAMN04488005_1757 [Yoonia tamlensis]